LHFAAEATRRQPRIDESIVLDQFLRQIERELVERALKRAKGNKARAARLLGLTRPRLYRRMVQLGLEETASVSDAASFRPPRSSDSKRRRKDTRPYAPDDSRATSTGEIDAQGIDGEAEFLEDIPFEEQPE
jgi:hypothetical protein